MRWLSMFNILWEIYSKTRNYDEFRTRGKCKKYFRMCRETKGQEIFIMFLKRDWTGQENIVYMTFSTVGGSNATN